MGEHAHQTAVPLHQSHAPQEDRSKSDPWRARQFAGPHRALISLDGWHR